jgi:urease accessory protein
MYAAISRSDDPNETVVPFPSLQRTAGRLNAAFVRDDAGRTRLRTLYQEGAFKGRLPAIPGQVRPELVLLNTAGGLTGGDTMAARIDIGDGATTDITTQAAEKIYRSTGADVRVDTTIDVGAGAEAHWLPQETILFDGARLDRRLTIDLAADARLLAVEPVLFGRAAMGERMQFGMFRDRWQVRRDGALVFADATRLAASVDDTLARAAVTNGGVAMATVLYVADDCETRLDAVRAIMARHGGDAGASAYDGLLLARLVAPTGEQLRRVLVPVLETLRDGRALPRPWFC